VLSLLLCFAYLTASGDDLSNAIIAINNLLLYRHVRATVLRGQKRAMEIERKLSTYNKNQTTGPEEEEDEDAIQKWPSGSVSMAASGSASLTSSGWGSSGRPSSVLGSSNKQWQRVRDVGTQSFLYVGAYFLCFTATIMKQSLDGQGYDKVEGSGSIFLPLIIIQSIFLPQQGMLNFLIHFRPKYVQARRKYTHETKMWCLKKAIFTDKIRPTTRPTSGISTPSQRGKADKQINGAGELATSRLSSRFSSRFGSHHSNVAPIGESANVDDQESVQSNQKKRSGTAKSVTYSDDSQVFSIEEELEISGHEEPASVSTTDSQSTENLEAPVSVPKRVSHTGEVEDVESDNEPGVGGCFTRRAP